MQKRKRELRKRRLKKPVRGGQDRLPGDPTDEEIKALCAEIQATWSEYEERKRRVGNFRYRVYEIPEARHRGVQFDSMNFD